MTTSDHSPLQRLPSVDSLLGDVQLSLSDAEAPRAAVVAAVRAAVDEARGRLRGGALADATEAELRQAILSRAVELARAGIRPHYRKVVNATGIIVHTGLGRAVLPQEALARLREELAGYSLLQLDAETGKRAKRDGPIERLLQRLTGCEAATVVNNNAAATLLVLNTVAAGREVIVSRGQLVEIGGSFRLPEVFAASGARLVEVGATNRTHPADYENAITENTAAILRVHPSNYKIRGFTSEVGLGELTAIAHAHRLVLIDDVGAGALTDLSHLGFHDEPTMPNSVRTGADIVTASADKLIGGPQGGIILGRTHLIEAVRKNPLARAVRADKMMLAALEATLALFLDESAALQHVPCLRMLGRQLPELVAQAERMVDVLRERTQGAEIAAVPGFSRMGSGSLPEEGLQTRLVAVASRAVGPDELALRLRRCEPPVFARIHKGQVLIDPRTLLEGEEEIVIQAVVEALGLEE